MFAGDAPLQSDLLYVVLFGPGYGESIVLRIPPDRWIAVDCCRLTGPDANRILPLELLPRREGFWSGVILTHPHEDHAAGMEILLSRLRDGFLGCADPSIENPQDWIHEPDAELQLRKGPLEAVMAAIQDHWERNPDSRWDLTAGTVRQVGDARITALWPDRSIQRSRRPKDPNRSSSPLWVEWEGVRLLLGADLPKSEWRTIGDVERDPPLSDHAVYKVAHHGSSGAIHRGVLGDSGNSARSWLIAPWNRGPGLPRFEDGQGVHLLLSCVDRLLLTRLPEKCSPTNSPPREATRQDIRDGKLPGMRRSKFDNQTIIPLPDSALEKDAWIALGFDRSGSLRDSRFGPATLRIKEGPVKPRPRIAGGRKRR